jgi:putative endonuclease
VAPQALSRLWSRLAGGRPGQAGEDRACAHLLASGFRILARNYRCRSGEVDVIAQDDDGAVVFVEVKERHSRSHGEGVESVSFGKRRRIIRAARLYAASRGISEQPIRFDVVAIDDVGGEPRIRHDRGAFDSEGR